MDEELGSSRFHPGRHSYDDNRRHQQRRGGGYRRGGGRGHHRHHRQDHRRGGRGGRGSGGSGGNRANRVSTSSTKVDPTKAMLAQLTGMVAKIGDLSNVTEDIVNVAENAQNLASVLCGDNAELFLKFEKPRDKGNVSSEQGGAGLSAMEVEGGTGEISSAENDNQATIATTVSSEKVISPIDAAGPTAALIVHCAASLPLQTPAYVTLTKEIELNAPDSHVNFASRCVTYALSIVKNDIKSLVALDRSVDILLRLKLLLRYLCLLEKIGVIGSDGNSCCSEILSNMFDLSKYENTHSMVKLSLSFLLMSTLPYFAMIKDGNTNFATEVIEAIESTQLPQVKKLFAPGIGIQAVYLKNEQKEDEGEEEDEDSDDDMDDENDNAVYESFSELFLAVKDLYENQWNASKLGEKLILTSDLTQSEATPIVCDFCLDWGSLKSSQNNEQGVLLVSVPSIISPRLPLSDADTNETTKSFYTSSSRLDRALLAQHIRDIMFAFRPKITTHGIPMGGVKLAAEQLLSIAKLLPNSEGLEYFLVDILLSLIVTNFNGEGIYFSRVLLELCKLNPDKVPLALALGVGTAVTELPTFIPSIRYSFSEWFAFHLTNTDYQWPYWQHWDDEESEQDDNPQSSYLTRHIFLRRTMTHMSSLYQTSVIENRVGPNMAKFIERSSFASELVDDENGSALACLTRELLERIRTRQPVEELVTWLISSSQHSDVAEATDNYKFWRSVAASHALLAASQQDIVGTQIGIERYSTLLKEAAAKDQEESGVSLESVEVAMLEEVLKLWKNSSMLESIVEEYVRYGVVGSYSIICWKFGSESTKNVNVKQLPLHYLSNVNMLKATVNILLHVLECDMREQSSTMHDNNEGSTTYIVGIDRIADFLSSLCCKVAGLVIEPGCSDIGGDQHFKAMKRSPLLVALVEGVKDVCAFTQKAISQSSMLNTNIDLKRKVKGSKMAEALRDSKYNSDSYSDFIIEEVAACLETCL